MPTGNPAPGIRVDSANAYWTDQGIPPNADGSVKKVPTSGGAMTALASGLVAPTALAIDATTAYFTLAGSLGQVMRVPLVGGTPVTLCAQAGTAAIEVDSYDVYWGDLAVSDNIGKIPIGGGTITSLATGLVTGLALDSTNVYWSDGNIKGLLKVPIGGGTPSTIWSGSDTPSALVVDATNLYWIDSTGVADHGSVLKLPLTGGTSTTLASGLPGPQALAVDGANVYWVDYIAGAVLSVPLSGGATTTLATGQQGPDAIALDSTSVYWANSDGSVWRRTPK